MVNTTYAVRQRGQTFAPAFSQIQETAMNIFDAVINSSVTKDRALRYQRIWVLARACNDVVRIASVSEIFGAAYANVDGNDRRVFTRRIHEECQPASDQECGQAIKLLEEQFGVANSAAQFYVTSPVIDRRVCRNCLYVDVGSSTCRWGSPSVNGTWPRVDMESDENWCWQFKQR